MNPCLLVAVLAYIGPGAGLGLLGALIAVASAVFAALFFVILWPARMLLRKAKTTGSESAQTSVHDGAAR